MIRINSLKLHYKQTDKDLINAIADRLRISVDDIEKFEIIRKSLDARKKNEICYIYSVDAVVKHEERILNNKRIKDIAPSKKILYNEPFHKGTKISSINRPVIIGFGPAGMFCAYKLAQAGLHPVVFERGQDIDSRTQDVRDFWENGHLKINSNVQFGEGGAGTFSDGKLNTMIHDNYGRISEVFRIFIENGADPSIAYNNKPHIGTDQLKIIIKNIRNNIISLGGEVHFGSCLTDIHFDDHNKLKSIIINNCKEIYCTDLVLAIGHSARDTFYMLNERNLALEKKAFAIGVRIQHPQELIGKAQYGNAWSELPAADYKLTYNTVSGRGVYSFCMCPGGFVVNASSEEGRTAVNGMSNSNRSETTANSALVVTVREDDFPGDSPLSGIEFQRELEEKCFTEGKGFIPGQYYIDFKDKRRTDNFSTQLPNTCGKCIPANLRNILPDYVCESIIEAMPHFGHTISGFDSPDALMLGLESRTSSPVRITRNETFEATGFCGIYPCGEGAGYAGGITSAAVDGIKVYEALILKYLS